MAPYSRKLARPFSACRLVMAAERVVYKWQFHVSHKVLIGEGQLSRRAYLSVIDVANGANVDVRLCSLEDGVCAVDVEDTRSVLLLQGGLKGVHTAGVKAASRGPQERRKRSEGSRHDDGRGIIQQIREDGRREGGEKGGG